MIALLLSLAVAQEPCVRIGAATFLGTEEPVGSVVIRGDTIALVSGPSVQAAIPDCRLLDVSESIVTPGLVAVSTALGLVEVNAVGGTRHMDAGGDPVRASLGVLDAYDPISSLIPITRERGVTHAVVFPGGGRIAGQAGFVRLAGSTQAEAVVDRSVAMIGNVGGSSFAGGLRDLSAVLDDTRFVLRSRRAVDAGDHRELSGHPRDLAAMEPVVRGDLPLVVSANRATEIEVLIRFAQEEGIRLVISGGAEAWRHADALAAAGIAVIVDPTLFGPGGFSQLDARPDNAALLAQAGVDVILSTFDSHNARTLQHVAGVAVSQGMDRTAALMAITSTPARVFGQPDRGRIAVGYKADLVVWTAFSPDMSFDPFEPMSSVSHVFIDGEEQSLYTRQDALRDRYRELPGSPIAPLVVE